MTKSNTFDKIVNSTLDIEKKYQMVNNHAVDIFGSLIDMDAGDIPLFEPSMKDEACQKFIYEWKIFQKKRIDWQDWCDIAEEGIAILKRFNQSEITDYTKTPGYSAFIKKVQQRINHLIRSGKYDNEFQEWGKDS